MRGKPFWRRCGGAKLSADPTRSDMEDPAMRLSTRNQLRGTITEVELGTVMAVVKVTLDGGDQVVTSSVTKDAATDLGLKVGQPATVFIKSTEVTIGVD
jgi:molybdopterin-binding protein